MEQSKKELMVARIISGMLRFKMGDIIIVMKKPPVEQLYVAEELYCQYKEELADEGCMSEEQAFDYLIKQGMWSNEKQEMLDVLVKHIEEFKVGLFNLRFKSIERHHTRIALTQARAKQVELYTEKNVLSYLTNSGAAALLKNRYLIAMSCYYISGEPVFTEDSFWKNDSSLFDNIVDFYYRTRLTESQFRELARTQPWRSHWNSRKSEIGVFGVASSQLSDEQRVLTTWSSMYDSIFEHSECPGDSVIEDDDTLDGWMIIQHKKHKDNTDKFSADNIIDNDKIKNCGEIFIPVNTAEDAKLINDSNDMQAQMIKKKRFAFLKNKEGFVDEFDLPDVTQNIQMESNRQFMEKAKGK